MTLLLDGSFSGCPQCRQWAQEFLQCTGNGRGEFFNVYLGHDTTHPKNSRFILQERSSALHCFHMRTRIFFLRCRRAQLRFVDRPACYCSSVLPNGRNGRSSERRGAFTERKPSSFESIWIQTNLLSSCCPSVFRLHGCDKRRRAVGFCPFRHSCSQRCG